MTIKVESTTEEPKTEASGQAPEKVGGQSAPEPVAAHEQNESPESDTEETEENEAETELEADAEGSDEEPEAKSAKDDKPRKKGGFQRRIDKLNAAKAEAQREAEYWRRVALDKQAPNESKPDPKFDPKSAAPVGKPKPEDFDTHAEFVEATLDWKLAEKEKSEGQKRRQSELEAEQANRAKTYGERCKSFTEEHDDFNEVVSTSESPMSPAMQEAILDSDIGPALAYELAKNEEEAKRIAALPPLAAAREMGKLEAKLASKSSVASKAETKKLTEAPKPIEPVGKGSPSKVAKSIYDPDLPLAEYERIRREQIKRRAEAG